PWLWYLVLATRPPPSPRTAGPPCSAGHAARSASWPRRRWRSARRSTTCWTAWSTPPRPASPTRWRPSRLPPPAQRP
ncbi:unnamed protein product, partial [Prorocentrum cordatum]